LKTLGNSTITGNFQVTVPRSVRELNLDNGDLLFFLSYHDEVAVEKGMVKNDK
jgi:bifunctional DNA-binding transcriptional regulator/antitoxin component of YhaV-PrlF toxin-antitoxin module